MMRAGHRLLAAILVLGGVAGSGGGAVVIDMPAAPVPSGPGAETAEPPDAAPAPRLGEVALRRYARAHSAASSTSRSGPAWRGWPYGGYGVGYGFRPSWPWGWGWGWNCGWGWGWAPGWKAWGYPIHGGWAPRSPYFGSSRFHRPHRSIHWTGAGFPGRQRWR